MSGRGTSAVTAMALMAWHGDLLGYFAGGLHTLMSMKCTRVLT